MRVAIYLLCALSYFVLAPAVAQGQSSVPANAFVFGDGWACNSGYKRVGNECQATRTTDTTRSYGARSGELSSYKRSRSAAGGLSVKTYTYDVSGYSYSSGSYLYGEIESTKGTRSVDGYLYDDEGNEIYVEGEWSGKGEAEVTDQDGNTYEIEVD